MPRIYVPELQGGSSIVRDRIDGLTPGGRRPVGDRPHRDERVPGRMAYDYAALRYAGQQVDPFERTAHWYRELGRRYPDPYAAKAAEVQMFNASLRRTPGTDVGPRHAVFVGNDVAGHRQTPWRSHGSAPTAPSSANDVHWDARRRVGYAPLGTRDSGYSEDWDSPEFRRRRSGRITSDGFDQKVYSDTPWLSLRARGGSAIITLTVGLANGGAEATRQFALGGGFTASFLLSSWDHARVEVDQLESDDVVIEFAWILEGLSAGDQTLYLPQNGVPAGAGNEVPEGAYGVLAATADANWVWTNPLLPGWASPQVNMGPTPTSGGSYFPVLGTQFTSTVPNDLLWFIRPL